jgi:hypothetical protein
MPIEWGRSLAKNTALISSFAEIPSSVRASLLLGTAQQSPTYCPSFVIPIAIPCAITVAPDGSELARASGTDDELLHALIDPTSPQYIQFANQNPYFEDRRPSLYGDLVLSSATVATTNTNTNIDASS